MKQVSRWARLAALCAVALITAPSEAQNYIRNPSFEEYNWDCWLTMYDITAVYAWSYPGCANKPGYYNACNTANDHAFVGVPANSYGYEEPADGAAYLGFFTYAPGWPYINGHTKKYAMTRLWQPLDAGQEYCIRMKVSLMDSSSYRTSAFHCMLTNDSTSACGYVDTLWANAAEVTLNTSLVDGNGWTLLEGSFIAAGGETTLTVGDFTRGAGLDTTFIAWRQYPYFSAYYVDEVYLGLCDNAIIDRPGSVPKLFISPNPVRQGEALWVSMENGPGFSWGPHATIEVIDQIGRTVMAKSVTGERVNLSIDALEPGNYFIRVYNEKATVNEILVVM